MSVNNRDYKNIYIKKLICHREIIERSCSENAKQDFDRISSRLFGTIFFRVFFTFPLNY